MKVNSDRKTKTTLLEGLHYTTLLQYTKAQYYNVLDNTNHYVQPCRVLFACITVTNHYPWSPQLTAGTLETITNNTSPQQFPPQSNPLLYQTLPLSRPFASHCVVSCYN